MRYESLLHVYMADPTLKRSYRNAKFTSISGTICFIVTIILLVYQYMYGQTRIGLIIWAVLLVGSILLSMLGRRMMRRVLLQAQKSAESRSQE